MTGSVRGVRRGVGAAALAAAAALGATAPPLAAQDNTGVIQGTVVDAGSRRPIVNAQVYLQGTQVGAQTNASGQYRIVSVSPGRRDVRVRMIGYGPASRMVDVVAGQTATADFQIQQSAIELSAVVTTGASGSQVIEERKLGNTVAVIEPPQDVPITNFSDVLQGREPGLVSLPSSGLTGEGARIRIRGNASMSQSNEPIVYVDGIRMNNSGGFAGFVGTGGGGSPSRLDDIDPTTIERVEVLKGAAAATLYGTEASNGVIQIFTKRGTTGAPKWQVQAEQAAIKYPTSRIDPQWGFARSDTQAVRLSRFYGRTITPFVPFSQQFATSLFETGNASTLSAQVNGGTPLVTYFVSGRFFREDGPFTAERWDTPIFGERFGVRSQDVNRKYQGTVNLTLRPSSTLNFGVRTSYSDGHLDIPENNNSIYSPYTVAMFSKPERANCDETRKLVSDTTQFSQIYAGNGLCVGPGNPTGASTFGTLRELTQRTIGQDVRHFNGVARGTYVPSAALSFDVNAGVDYAHQRDVAFLPFGNNIDRRTAQANEGDRDVGDRAQQEITIGANGTWTADFTPSLNSQLLFGGQGFLTRINTESSTNQQFPGRGIEIVSGGAVPQVFEAFTQTVNAGFFAQEQLGWRDWLFATVGARYDYNSAFGEEAGGVLYPKVSLSIVPSDRPGYPDSRLGSMLSTFRLRAAIGQAGRQPGAFDKLTTYAALTSPEGAGLVPANLGNQSLEPEISTEWEVGTELGFFDNRLAVEFTRWDRRLEDALVLKQFPVTGGFRAQQLVNIGEMKAFGWELSLKGFAVNRPNVSVDLFANTSFLSQLVTSLGGAGELKVGGSYPRYRNFITEGYAPGAFFGGEVRPACPAGRTTMPQGGPCLLPGQLPFDLDRNGVPDTEAEWIAALPTRTVNPNDPNFINIFDPLPADNDNDRNLLDHYQGKPYPDFQGGFGGGVTLLRNWKINTLFEYKTGRYTVSNLTDAFRTSSNANGANTNRRAVVEAILADPSRTPQEKLAAAKEWAADLRALTPYDGLNQNSPGDFLRWRELSLTYNTPVGFANRVGATDLAITIGGRNLMLWTKYAGVDPEVNVYGRGAGGTATDINFGDAIDAFGFPIPRRFTFSVRAGF